VMEDIPNVTPRHTSANFSAGNSIKSHTSTAGEQALDSISEHEKALRGTSSLGVNNRPQARRGTRRKAKVNSIRLRLPEADVKKLDELCDKFNLKERSSALELLLDSFASPVDNWTSSVNNPHESTRNQPLGSEQPPPLNGFHTNKPTAETDGIIGRSTWRAQDQHSR